MQNNDSVTGMNVFSFCLLPSFFLMYATLALKIAIDPFFPSRKGTHSRRIVSLEYFSSTPGKCL